MFIASHEWSEPVAEKTAGADSGFEHLLHALCERANFSLYHRLSAGVPDQPARIEAASFLRRQLALLETESADLPESPGNLHGWMQESTQLATASYSAYLRERKAGAPRRYFSSRAHALYFLRAAAPTKLVDGAWLYGLMQHWQNPRFSDLVKTYVEELGEGLPDKNHVAIYRKLLSRHGLDPVEDLADAFYTQGLVQLALGCNTEAFLPEIIGFNLGYEQLPLHLLITAHELDELGLDPYYFTLHVTVDNAASGHARAAVQAVHDNMPQVGDARDFWLRVRRGSQLSSVGTGTNELIAGFNIEREVVRIFARKSIAGHGAHSDYCKVAGRTVNDWLEDPEEIPAFLAALQNQGWIKRGKPVEESRFWNLLQGSRAEMFGVFGGYELQLIHDWIRGPASADGKAYNQAELPNGRSRRASFRASARAASMNRSSAPGARDDEALFDPDVQALICRLALLDKSSQLKLLLQNMGAARHWTPAGLYATRQFCSQLFLS